MSARFANQDSSRLGAAQNVAFNAAGGASAASTPFGAQTYQIRVLGVWNRLCSRYGWRSGSHRGWHADRCGD